MIAPNVDVSTAIQDKVSYSWFAQYLFEIQIQKYKFKYNVSKYGLLRAFLQVMNMDFDN